MKFASLFDGISGFILAGERAGMECAWRCEIDRKCNELAAKHYPNLKTIEDVRNVGKHNAEPVDLICGGFPCQDLSIAGRREGLAGERSGLWWEFARVIEELIPAWVVIENVPGLLSSNGGRDFAAIIRWLAQRGYGVVWRVLDAQYFGVAQRRRRVFIVGHLGDGRAAEALFERDGVRGNTPASRKARKDIAGTLDAKSASGDRGSQSNEVDFIVCAHETGKGFWSEGLPGLRANPGGMPENIIAGSVSAKWAKGTGGPAGDEAYNLIAWQDSRRDSVRIIDDVCNTLDSHMGTGGNNVPLVGVRRLTTTECERIQGFLDGWTEGQSDTTRYRQLGSAVAVPVVEWIMRRIAEVSA